MPEAQAKRLREMMHTVPSSSLLDACIMPLDIKKSAIGKLESGDIIVLPFRTIDLFVVDASRHLFAEGEYGIYAETPSVLINTIEKTPPAEVDSNKYKSFGTSPFWVSLGTIERKRLDRGKIVPLHRDWSYDAALYAGKKIVAYASLVQAGKKIALRIEEVV